MRTSLSSSPEEVALEQARHEAEVRYIVHKYFPNGDQAHAFIHACEERRGKAAADRLRNDVRILWQQMRADRNQQAREAA